MKINSVNSILFAFTAIVLSSCSVEDRVDSHFDALETQTIFNISLSDNTRSKTKSKSTTKAVMDSKTSKAETDSKTSYDSEKKHAYMDSNIAFGLVGIDNESKDVLVNNQPVYEVNGVRKANIVTSYLSSGSLKLSAFYPHTSNVSYHKDCSYVVTFSADDVKKGPLASNTVDMKCGEAHETVNLHFHHISNSIGFKVCDITDDEQLKGLMNVRKVILHGMPTDGMYVINSNEGYWVPGVKREDIVLYEGNDFVEYSEENALFVSENRLSDAKEDCNRIYVVPELLKDGHHYVEIVFDIKPFYYDGTYYRGSEGRKQIIPLSGVIPDDMFELGLQYTFVLGMNVGTIYRPIEFTASIDEWEAKYGSRIIDYDNE